MTDQKLNSSKVNKEDWLWLKSEIESLLSKKLSDVDFFDLCGKKRKLAYDRGFTSDEYQKAYSRVLYLNQQPKPKPEPEPPKEKEGALLAKAKIDARRCSPVQSSPTPSQTKPPKRDGSALDRMINETIEKRKSR